MSKRTAEVMKAARGASADAAVMSRLRAPFGCEFIPNAKDPQLARWRIHDANDDAIASVSRFEEGYARLIVDALNERFRANGGRHEIDPGTLAD